MITTNGSVTDRKIEYAAREEQGLRIFLRSLPPYRATARVIPPSASVRQPRSGGQPLQRRATQARWACRAALSSTACAAWRSARTCDEPGQAPRGVDDVQHLLEVVLRLQTAEVCVCV